MDENTETADAAAHVPGIGGVADPGDPQPAPHDGLFSAERSAEVVAAAFARTPDDRLREVLTSLTGHLHAFVKDVGLTPAEWRSAIAFLTDTGRTCGETRQEFVLLSDVLGVSMLVDTLANGTLGDATESTVEGPFHVVASPPRALGDDINDDGRAGLPCLFTGRVLDPEGAPVAGALVDVWQADAEGYYDVQLPGGAPAGNLRGLFTTDADGAYRFRTIVPRHYPIPDDGPVGRLLRATRRHPNRPAHIHLEVSAPGLRTLTTHLFVAGSPYLDSDAVFGVKESLVREFTPVDDPEKAVAAGLPCPYRTVDFPVTLRRDEPGPAPGDGA
ncbi:dioxygenase [Streptomyces sp. NPDC008150]|uniref:dioxygenase family protein n=1 Tax=Streptomyces sp. NPDC008150 TaxID=3364816 RepID=UPI0036EEE635